MLGAFPEGVVQAEGMIGVVIFAVAYAIVAILGKMKEAQKRTSGGSKPVPRRPPPQQRMPMPPRSSPRAETRGNTQSEATRLEELLRALGEAAGVPTTQGPVGRPARVPLPSNEEIEERESLEIEEQIENLETQVLRPVRRTVDHDDEAEALVQRRIQAAQLRDGSLNREDHKAFDRRIRAAAADQTRVAKPKHPSLRQAIIWRELLGPPLALRDRTDLDH